MSTLRGRWAQGLEPRFFFWVVKDRLAGSERPDGFARNHRKVRRQEELIWLAREGFTHVLSLLSSPHNLHAYDESGLGYRQVPLGRPDELHETLPAIYETLATLLDDPVARVLVHHEEFGDRLLGVLAGFLIYIGKVSQGPQATVLMERLARRQIGAEGREVVAATLDGNLRRAAS